MSPEAKGEENWEEIYPLLIRLLGLGERRELSQLGPGGAQAENGFIAI